MSLSHAVIRERGPDWEVMFEEEPLWSSSEKADRVWALFFDNTRKKGKTDLISGRGRLRRKLMDESLLGSQNGERQQRIVVGVRFSAGGYAGYQPFDVR